MGGVDCRQYPRFTATIIGSANNNEPLVRPLPWLMRIIEEVYDSRYVHDTADLQHSSSGPDGAPEAAISTAEGAGGPPPRAANLFPLFVIDHLSKRHGLRPLVEKMAWEVRRRMNDS